MKRENLKEFFIKDKNLGIQLSDRETVLFAPSSGFDLGSAIHPPPPYIHLYTEPGTKYFRFCELHESS